MLPTLDEIFAIIKEEHTATDWADLNKLWDPEIDDGDPYVDVRLRVYPEETWDVLFGQSCYDQDLRGFCGGASIHESDTEEELREVAQALLDEVQSEMAWRKV